MDLGRIALPFGVSAYGDPMQTPPSPNIDERIVEAIHNERRGEMLAIFIVTLLVFLSAVGVYILDGSSNKISRTIRVFVIGMILVGYGKYKDYEYGEPPTSVQAGRKTHIRDQYLKGRIRYQMSQDPTIAARYAKKLNL